MTSRCLCSYLHSNALLNIKMYSCISLGLKITQIKIPRNIVERLWQISNVTSNEDFQISVYTLGEFHKNRKNSTVFEELELSISVLLASFCVASKTAFATVKSTIDTSNSSNTVLIVYSWFLPWFSLTFIWIEM
jgi:hypothetical protein